MFRFVLLMIVSTGAYAAQSTVDIETAAKIYQDAAIRDQVRASLGAMPAHIRQLFSADTAAKLSDQQLNAVTEAAKKGFRIDVFEVPALGALAANLDPATVKKTENFLSSDLGRRMVAADVAQASLEEATTDKIMNGEITAPSTPQRDVLFDKLEQASRSTESTVQISSAWDRPLPSAPPWDRAGIPKPWRKAHANPARRAAPLSNKACASRCAATWPMGIGP